MSMTLFKKSRLVGQKDIMSSDDRAFAERWIGYRPNLKILDCTLRDGGLMNAHRFTDGFVKAVYAACAAAGIDIIEVGYKASKRIFAPAEFGKWKYCSEDDLRRVIGDDPTKIMLSVMADAERTDYREDIEPKSRSVIDIVRVAAYIHQIPAALDIVKDAHDKGYMATANIMAVSTVPEAELEKGLELLARSEAEVIYLVDSYGALYSEQVHYLLAKYRRYAGAAGKMVGMHAHNNQELAFANTIEAIIHGVDFVDGTLAGMGRGAGNCRTESLVSFLHNPKYKLQPLLECIGKHIEPLRHDLNWGFDVTYMLTGVFNRHPSAAIEFNRSHDRGDYLKFYNSLVEE